MTDDKLSSYHFDKFTDLHGREMDLPSLMKHSFCSVCKCMIVRRRITDWQLAAIRRYLRSGWVKYRNATPLNGRPVCEWCHQDWVETNRVKVVTSANG
jgi:hypothetical protein